jgi:hypothetical protein
MGIPAQPVDANGETLTTVFNPSGASQNLAMTASSVASAIFSATEPVIVRIASTAAVNYTIAAVPVATASSVYLPANWVEEIFVPANHKVAAIGAAGTVNLAINKGVGE